MIHQIDMPSLRLDNPVGPNDFLAWDLEFLRLWTRYSQRSGHFELTLFVALACSEIPSPLWAGLSHMEIFLSFQSFESVSSVHTRNHRHSKPAHCRTWPLRSECAGFGIQLCFNALGWWPPKLVSGSSALVAPSFRWGPLDKALVRNDGLRK